MRCRRSWCVAAAALSLALVGVPRSVSAQRRTAGAIPDLTVARQITPSFHRLPPFVLAGNDTTVAKESRRSRHAKTGALIGIIGGGILGGVVASGLNDMGDSNDAGESFGSVVVAVVGGALFFGLIGAVVGALVP